MKGSNNILLGFIILVFATPVFLFIGFRNKIRKGEFTVAKIPEDSTRKDFFSGSIKPFKVLKVVGPGMEGVFDCTIIPSDSATYDYANNYDDQGSINMQQKGDTLVLTYIGSRGTANGNTITTVYPLLYVKLHLPVIKNIIAEGADIRIDSVSTGANPEIYFDLRKKAVLTLGMSGTSTTTFAHFEQKGATVGGYKAVSNVIEKSTGQFNKVIIKASDSHITFGTVAWIHDLNLQLQGVSTITMDNNSRITQLNGFISDSAKVEANWKNIRRLATLTGNIQ
jgi:hypothetical protein